MTSAVPYWRLSGFYFFYFSTLGGFLPFWSLYLEAKGFNPLEMGQLTAFLLGTKIIAPNFWGWMADRTGKCMRSIRIASFLATAIFTGFFFVAGYRDYALITIGFSFFWNAALPQFEAATLFHLKTNSHGYSRIRLWGSIGFILTVLGIGRGLDELPISLLPYVIAVLLLLVWLLTLITPEASASPEQQDETGLYSILKKPEVIAFLLIYMLLQMAHGPYYVFFSIYLHNFAYNGTIIGQLWALGVLAEIFLFIFMQPILKAFSLRNIVLLSIVLSILRWLLIAWGISYIGLLLFAQVLHAASFGATHVAAIHLVQRYFGIQHQGKGQALYTSMSFGMGGMLGSLYSGYCWELLGAQYVYTIAAGFCVLALIFAMIWIDREKAPEFA